MLQQRPLTPIGPVGAQSPSGGARGATNIGGPPLQLTHMQPLQPTLVASPQQRQMTAGATGTQPRGMGMVQSQPPFVAGQPLPFPVFSSVESLQAAGLPTPMHSRGPSTIGPASPLRGPPHDASLTGFSAAVNAQQLQKQQQQRPQNASPINSTAWPLNPVPAPPTAGATAQHGTVGPVAAAAVGSAAGVPPIKERVTAFYNKYNPMKLSSVDDIIKSYAGRDAELMRALVAKYGPEEIWWTNSLQLNNNGQRQPAPLQVQHLNPTLATAAAGGPPQQHSLPAGGRLVAQFLPGASLAMAPPAASAAASPPQAPSPTFAGVLPAAQAQASSTRNPASYEQRVFQILVRHDPSKIPLIPQMLTAFRGTEESLIGALLQKYGVPLHQQQTQLASASSSGAALPSPSGTPQAAVDANRVGATLPGALNVTTQHSGVAASGATLPLSERRLAPQSTVGQSTATPAKDESNPAVLRKSGTRTSHQRALEKHRPSKFSELVVSDSDSDSVEDDHAAADPLPPTDISSSRMGEQLPSVPLSGGDVPAVDVSSINPQANQLPSAPPTPRNRDDDEQQSTRAAAESRDSTTNPAAAATTTTTTVTSTVSAAPPSVVRSGTVSPPGARTSATAAASAPPLVRDEPHPAAHQAPSTAGTKRRANTPLKRDVAPTHSAKLSGHAGDNAAASTSGDEGHHRRTQRSEGTAFDVSLSSSTHTGRPSAEVQRPLTERRTNRDSIVIAPVVALGSADHHEPPPPHSSRNEEPRAVAGTYHYHSRQPQSDRFAYPATNTAVDVAASLGAPSRDHSVTAHDQWFRGHAASLDSRNVSISPMSRSESVDGDREGRVALPENVGCEASRRRIPFRQSRSGAERWSAEERWHKGVREEGRHGEEGESSTPRCDGRPLWINPAAKGRLSTVYEKSKEQCQATGSGQSTRRSSSADAIARRIYSRRPTPPPLVPSSIGQEVPSRAAASRPHAGVLRVTSVNAAPSTMPVRASSAPRTDGGALRPPLPASGRQPATADRSRLSDDSTQTDDVPQVEAPTRQKAQRTTTVSPATKRAPNDTGRVSPAAKRADLSNMLYRQIGRQTTVSGAMDLVVVDLRHDFKPNIRHPPEPESLIGSKANASLSSSRIEHPSPKLKRGGDQEGGAGVSGGGGDATELSPESQPRPPAHRSPKRKVVGLDHIPKELPFDLYSTFKDTSKGRPSAWAKAPSKIGLFDPLAHSAEGGGGSADGVQHRARSKNGEPATAIRYDEFGRRLKVILDVPTSREAVEAQRSLDRRLSAPKPVFVRREELHDGGKEGTH